MIEINFFVLGIPVPTPRPRVTKTGVYYSQRYKDWITDIQTAAEAKGKQLLPAPIAVALLFYLPTRRRVDVDNLAKSVLDALTGIFWQDDNDVTTLYALKRKTPDLHSSGVAIRVMHNEHGFYDQLLLLPRPNAPRKERDNGNH